MQITNRVCFFRYPPPQNQEVAQRLHFDWSESLTIGRAVADWLALRKGESLGILDPEEEAEKAKQASYKRGGDNEDLPSRAVEMMVGATRNVPCSG